ncbi:MAG: hypothetical protein ABSE20_30070 [Acetobacteraceae bacterium]|jgi:hypothetical protein
MQYFPAAAARRVCHVRIPYDPILQRRRRPADPLRYARVLALRCLAAFYGMI